MLRIRFWPSLLDIEEGVGILSHTSRTVVLLLPPLSGWWDMHAADDPFVTKDPPSPDRLLHSCPFEIEAAPLRLTPDVPLS